MTNTASFIRHAEAADDPAEQRSALAPGATDSIFRQVLALTYDPYIRFGLGDPCTVSPCTVSPWPAIVSSSAVNAALEDTWHLFEKECLATHSVKQLYIKWESSPAWPVYARVLSKRFFEVSFEVANLWGSLPLIQAAHPQKDEALPALPFLTLAEPTPMRALMVIRNPFDGFPVTHWFSVEGESLTHTIASSVIERARDVPWIQLGLDLKEYGEGIVYDGYLANLTGHRSYFAAADIIPLAKFKEQQATKPFADRLDDVFKFNPFADTALGCVTYVEASKDDHVEILRRHTVEDYPWAGVLALDPRASYPYHPTSAGIAWLREPN